MTACNRGQDRQRDRMPPRETETVTECDLGKTKSGVSKTDYVPQESYRAVRTYRVHGLIPPPRAASCKGSALEPGTLRALVPALLHS